MGKEARMRWGNPDVRHEIALHFSVQYRTIFLEFWKNLVNGGEAL
jgi:hypothetical protein